MFNAQDVKIQTEEAQGEDTAIVLGQNKGDNSFLCQGARSCFYYEKLGHIACFCNKAKLMSAKNEKNVNDDDDYAFAMRDGYISRVRVNES